MKQDATTIAQSLAVPSVKKVVTITEDNDPNHLIGRPNGYVSAAILYDAGTKCSSLGASCGATVAVWPTPADAERRSAYFLGLRKDTPACGTEYHTVRGAALLRVTGQLKPSVAAQYAAAFQR